MATLPFDSLELARARSAEMWAAARGPGWREGNVTVMLYACSDAETPQMQIERDRYLDKLVLEEQLTDDELTALVSVYPPWANETQYAIDDLAAYDDQLYRCCQAHTSQADWTPPQVPALWVRMTPEGVIPEWVQPTGAHDAYELGAQVTHNGYIWTSLYAANVWEPGVFGWERGDPV